MSSHPHLRDAVDPSIVSKSVLGALAVFLVIAGCAPLDHTTTTSAVVEVLQTRLETEGEDLPTITTSSVDTAQITEEPPTTTIPVGIGDNLVEPATAPPSLPLGRPCVPIRPCVK